MTPLSNKDMQSALEKTRSNLQASLASKNDIQAAMSQLKNGITQEMKSLHSENQAAIQNGQARHDQINLRLTTIERNIQGLTHEIAKISDSLGKISATNNTRTDNANNFYYQRI